MGFIPGTANCSLTAALWRTSSKSRFEPLQRSGNRLGSLLCWNIHGATAFPQRCDPRKQVMSRFLWTVLVAAALAPFQPALAQSPDPVDLLLVLASDVSRSVDHPKFMLQREGYAAAVSDPQVLDAIRNGPHGKIAISFVEWSGFGAQKVVINWSMIDGPATARRFGDQLAELPRSF